MKRPATPADIGILTTAGPWMLTALGEPDPDALDCVGALGRRILLEAIDTACQDYAPSALRTERGFTLGALLRELGLLVQDATGYTWAALPGLCDEAAWALLRQAVTQTNTGTGISPALAALALRSSLEGARLPGPLPTPMRGVLPWFSDAALLAFLDSPGVTVGEALEKAQTITRTTDPQRRAGRAPIPAWWRGEGAS